MDAVTGPAAGEPTMHSNKLYDAPAGVGPGDAVTVARQPIVRDGKVLAKASSTIRLIPRHKVEQGSREAVGG